MTENFKLKHTFASNASNDEPGTVAFGQLFGSNYRYACSGWKSKIDKQGARQQRAEPEGCRRLSRRRKCSAVQDFIGVGDAAIKSNACLMTITMRSPGDAGIR